MTKRADAPVMASITPFSSRQGADGLAALDILGKECSPDRADTDIVSVDVSDVSVTVEPTMTHTASPPQKVVGKVPEGWINGRGSSSGLVGQMSIDDFT